MTNFCSADQVKQIVDTTLDDDDIDELVEESDAYIKKKTGISSPTGNDVYIFRLISRLLTAIQIKNKDPHAMAIGSYSESHYPIPAWQGDADKLLKLYSASSATVKTRDYETSNMQDRWDE